MIKYKNKALLLVPGTKSFAMCKLCSNNNGENKVESVAYSYLGK